MVVGFKRIQERRGIGGYNGYVFKDNPVEKNDIDFIYVYFAVYVLLEGMYDAFDDPGLYSRKLQGNIECNLQGYNSDNNTD